MSQRNPSDSCSGTVTFFAPAAIAIAIVGGGAVIDSEPGGVTVLAGAAGGGGPGGTGLTLAPAGAPGSALTIANY